MKEWENISDWWDKKQGDVGDLWHRNLILPALISVIGNCRDKDVLDLGCGNGYISRMLARKGARVTAIDSSPRMIRNAKSHDPDDSLKIAHLLSDATRLKFGDETYDLVFANMSLMDMKNCEDAIPEVARVLRYNGRFVASIPHPCFDTGSNSRWIAEKELYQKAKVYRKVRAYRNPFSEKVPWWVSVNETKYTWFFHRPLNWYAKMLWSSGLAITALEEPAPTQAFFREERKKEGDLDAPGFLELPLHLVIEAMKI